MSTYGGSDPGDGRDSQTSEQTTTMTSSGSSSSVTGIEINRSLPSFAGKYGMSSGNIVQSIRNQDDKKNMEKTTDNKNNNTNQQDGELNFQELRERVFQELGNTPSLASQSRKNKSDRERVKNFLNRFGVLDYVNERAEAYHKKYDDRKDPDLTALVGNLAGEDVGDASDFWELLKNEKERNDKLLEQHEKIEQVPNIIYQILLSLGLDSFLRAGVQSRAYTEDSTAISAQGAEIVKSDHPLLRVIFCVADGFADQVLKMQAVALTLYILICLFVFPLSYMFVDFRALDKDDGVLIAPSARFAAWTIQDTLVWAALWALCLIVLVVLRVAMASRDLWVLGSLYERFRAFHRDDDDVCDNSGVDQEDQGHGTTSFPKDGSWPRKLGWGLRTFWKECYWLECFCKASQASSSEDEDVEAGKKRAIEKHQIRNLRELLGSRHRILARSLAILVLVLFICNGFYNIYLKIIDQQGGFFWLFMFFIYLVAAIPGVLNGVACALVVADTTTLMTANIGAYEEILKLCVFLIESKRTSFNPRMTPKEIREDPLVKQVGDRLKSYEDYLNSVSKTLKATLEKHANSVFACVFFLYFFVLFFVYSSSLELSQSRVIQDYAQDFDSANTEDKVKVWTTFGWALGAAVWIFPICFPLHCMASQAGAWEQLIRGLETPTHQQVSLILSPSGDDQYFLKNRHEALQPKFTWKILGVSMSYSAVASVLFGFLGTLWTLVVWPSIQGNADLVLAQLLQNNLNATGDAEI